MAENIKVSEKHQAEPSVKAILGDFFVYGAGEILLRVSAFITLPIYTRLFSPSEFGIWSLVATSANILAILFTLGGETAYARLYFEAKNESDRRRLLSTWLTFLLIWGAGGLALLLPLGSHASTLLFGTPNHAVLLWLSLLALPVAAANSICSQVVRNQFKAKLFVTLNLISTILVVVGSLYCVLVLKLGIAGLLIGSLAANCIILPIRLWIIRAEIELVFYPPALKAMFHFGAPLVPMSLAYSIFSMSDRMLLGKMATVEEVGFYAIATNLASILYMFNNALGQAWGPHAVRLHEQHPSTAPYIFGRTLNYILVAAGVLSVTVTAFATEILRVLVSPSYWKAYLAVGPLAITSVAMASTQITALGISLSKKTKYFAYYAWLAALLNILVNIILIPPFGMLGAAIASAVTYLFLTFAYCLRSQKLIPVRYEIRKVFSIAILTAIFVAGCAFFPMEESLAVIIGKALCVISYLTLLILIGGINKHDIQHVQLMLKKILGLKQYG